MFFFFKQTTAYDMRISDCSSDVCSSDLRLVDAVHLQRHLAEPDDLRAQRTVGPTGRTEAFARQRLAPGADAATDQPARLQQLAAHEIGRASCRERVCQDV